MRNNYFVYNRYSRIYNVINDIKTIIKHLKKTHFIDFTISDIIEKKIKEKIIINAIIFYNIEINIKTKEKRKKKIINRDLNKITLKYLFLRCIVFINIFFKIIRYKNFRI